MLTRHPPALEAASCLRALLEAALNAAGAVTVLRPMLTYALCAALYSPLGEAARQGLPDIVCRVVQRIRTPHCLSQVACCDAHSQYLAGPTARRGALAGELAALRAADPGSTVSEGWEAAAGATVQALEAAESRLRELARAATGPQASSDVEAVVEMECEAGTDAKPSFLESTCSR